MKTKGGGAGTKADHVDIIYKQNVNENIKKSTHTLAPNHTFKYSSKHRKNESKIDVRTHCVDKNVKTQKKHREKVHVSIEILFKPTRQETKGKHNINQSARVSKVWFSIRPTDHGPNISANKSHFLF